MPFTPIGDALKDSVGGKGNLKKQVETAEIIDIASHVFTEMFGEDLAVHSKPLFLKNRTLTVTCSSSEMAQEIRLNQKKIVKKINEALGKNDVDRIRYLA